MHKWGLGLTGLVSGVVSALLQYLFLPLVFYLSWNTNSETLYSVISSLIFPGVIYLVSILIYLRITGLFKTFSNKKLFSLYILFAHIILALFYISASFFYLPLTALFGKYFGSSPAYLPLIIFSIIAGVIPYILWGSFIIKSFQKLIPRETCKFSNWLILVAGLSIILGGYLSAWFLQNIFNEVSWWSASFTHWLIPYVVVSFVLGWAIDKVRNRTSPSG